MAVRNVFLDIPFEGFQQLGFSAAAHAGDHFNVRRSDHMHQLVQIFFAFDQFHPSSPHSGSIPKTHAKINIFSFLANRHIAAYIECVIRVPKPR